MAVPDTTTFSLQDVVTEINPTTDDLVDCFADAVSGSFDPSYSGSKNNLLNFRNYGATSGNQIKSGSTAVSVNIGESNWINPTRVLTNSGGSFATAASTYIDPASTSDILRVSDFGFTIPGGSTITGFTITIVRSPSGGGSGNTYDDSIQFVIGSTAQGTAKADATVWADTWVESSLGGSSDMWGTTLSVAQVNASTFGVDIKIKTTDAVNSINAFIEYVSVQVHYT
jgi:hypothetical protein